ncbi:predicted protein [Naegleria gruberi]|uniref:Predicted protein n=1 Tax=Naegleria gruberi TaxID=5762 RepID=D2UZC5_NAEGR|nr:uncharacterized protein NAEGRDRAFT_61889 [Naegleria gruberi]EFC49924.1 predicted protein [Naegleria gruberi]|eukprot:XP_002682668.1 predicted protein [Naegleria gruberi strain NEG-M]
MNSDLNTYQTSEHRNTSITIDTSQPLQTIVSSSTKIPLNFEDSTLLHSDSAYRTFSNAFYLDMKDKLVNLPAYQALQGVWSPSSKIDPSKFNLVFTVPIFDANNLQLYGITQVEYPLQALAHLMRTFTYQSKGYIVLSDLNTEKVVISSLPDSYTLKSIYDIKELNIGKLMTYLKQNSFLDFNSEISVSGVEFEGLVYNMLNTKFSYNNVNLGMTIVLVDDSVQEFHNDTLYLAICISVGYVVIGLVMAIILGFLISKPLKALSVEFGHIKHMDLEKVRQHFSMFGEFQVLFQKLDEMVVWLNDVRSFIPNSILMEIRGDSIDNDVTETEIVTTNINVKDKLAETKGRASSEIPENSIANIAKGFKTYQEYSVLYMRIMDLESLTVTERAFYFEKVLEISSKIAKKNNGDIQLLDISRIRIYYCDPNNENASKKVITMALKILSVVADFSSTMEQQGKLPCNLIISISTQKALVGNIGTREHRIHTIVSRSISLCEQMMLIAKSLNISLIVDSNSCAANLGNYVYRPVDRISVEDDLMVIYEIFRENQVNDQEWMYELDQKEKNSSYNEYQSAFQTLLKGGPKIEEYREAILKVRRFKGSNGFDRDLTADHLIFMLERVSESCERGLSEKLSPQFTSSYQYCSRIYTEWENKFGMDVLKIRPVEIVNNK